MNYRKININKDLSINHKNENKYAVKHQKLPSIIRIKEKKLKAIKKKLNKK